MRLGKKWFVNTMCVPAVRRKFLDAQRIHNLTSYLEQLHAQVSGPCSASCHFSFLRTQTLLVPRACRVVHRHSQAVLNWGSRCVYDPAHSRH